MNLDTAREILLDHSRSKLNGKFPISTNYESQITNPICGDQVQIKLYVVDHGISDIGFRAESCAICSASTSLMSQSVKGMTVNDARAVSELFEKSILDPITEVWPSKIDALKSFEHLKINHARRTCAMLPWIALRSATKEIL